VNVLTLALALLVREEEKRKKHAARPLQALRRGSIVLTSMLFTHVCFEEIKKAKKKKQITVASRLS
jgi:hypothetical protein